MSTDIGPTLLEYLTDLEGGVAELRNTGRICIAN